MPLRRRFTAFVYLLMFGLLLPHVAHAQKKPASAKPAGSPALQSAIRAGQLPDMRWPNFSDYRVQIDNFYKASNYSLAWIEAGTPTDHARQMIAILSAADSQGLNAEDYDGLRWPDRISKLAAAHAPEDEDVFDLALTVSTMRYISDMHIGRINPTHFQFGLDVEHKKLDLPSFVRNMLSSPDDLTHTIAKVGPPFAGYEATRQAMLQYTQLAKQPDTEKLPLPVGVVYQGGYYDHMPALAKRLQQLGDLDPKVIILADAIKYDDPLMGGVAHFQSRHGLPNDGNLTSDTIDALNIPIADRLEQLKLALERYRWIRYQFTSPPVVVNVPEFKLFGYDGSGTQILSMGVNVGDAFDFQTPIFEGDIRYIVFRPYWYVTPTIQRDEMVPSVEEDRTYLEQNEMEVVDKDGKVIASGAISDAVLKHLKNGSYSIRQRPGADNALGLVKIIFPNSHNVYLHDTPEFKTMFSKAPRALSHGCIHLEKPADLAYWLLRDKTDWSLDKVKEAMQHGRDNSSVTLTKPVPILILYVTARAQTNGTVQFFKDIYGHDVELKAALAKGYPYP
ncbi:conserved hypothetical protein [Candidatus Koribacter versatilis Ellin345]|uniref:L,D-TPase catalytic domain-containing protein n=1 Tax=Koribacter versatilis (strain Ellin345) TaxID=204669 RepID=Q1IQF0_KORVE|nr:L,D-transpeptidase family protein [Candidatus Koribacter versatilis]ABF40900.1 conserved hypothetical protein [Candidatus Koribacter versatilis Ellin345]